MPLPEPGIPRYAASFDTVSLRDHDGKSYVLFTGYEGRLAAAVRIDAMTVVDRWNDEDRAERHALECLAADEWDAREEAARKARWNSLTPEQQDAERAERKAALARMRLAER